MNNFIASDFSVFQSDIALTEVLLYSQDLFLSVVIILVGFYIANTHRWQKAEVAEQKKELQKFGID